MHGTRALGTQVPCIFFFFFNFQFVITWLSKNWVLNWNSIFKKLSLKKNDISLISLKNEGKRYIFYLKRAFVHFRRKTFCVNILCAMVLLCGLQSTIYRAHLEGRNEIISKLSSILHGWRVRGAKQIYSIHSCT